LRAVLDELTDREPSLNEATAHVHPDYRLSAKNLLRYLILRSKDLRVYHGALSDLGLSSLRSAEGYVYSNLHSVVSNLRLMRPDADRTPSAWDTPVRTPPPAIDVVGYTKSVELLNQHADRLFNAARERRRTHIMVTLPDEAAADRRVIEEMVANGMDVARINLSHGDENIWRKMVDGVRAVSRETGKPIKIYMDLAGPKLRTAAIRIDTKRGKVKRKVRLEKGARLTLTKRETLGRQWKVCEGTREVRCAEVGVMLGAVVDDAQPGDRILFDDGMIEGRVVSKRPDEIELWITQCYKPKLGEHKGINLPDTHLHLPALTVADVVVLPFVCAHADLVGYSFVRTADDVAQLYDALAKHDADHLGVVFKIENQEAFDNLPAILIRGMSREPIGIMIARGDLAVEIGFERISEVQNEILWLCEAAHVPVIWATQVLETLAKAGLPTRAEVSDAAQGAQAECVMLNKGPNINRTIRMLQDILIRMGGHALKKKNELRALNVARRYVETLPTEPAAAVPL
ncbi:MAG: pyruvate kinase, partial [Catalinimonas sp.]